MVNDNAAAPLPYFSGWFILPVKDSFFIGLLQLYPNKSTSAARRQAWRLRAYKHL